jgi:hypothetical protein
VKVNQHSFYVFLDDYSPDYIQKSMLVFKVFNGLYDYRTPSIKY